MVFDVTILTQSAQHVHCFVNHRTLHKSFDCTFVYGHNEESEHVKLWVELKTIAGQGVHGSLVGISTSPLILKIDWDPRYLGGILPRLGNVLIFVR